jgi:hypothetical protein
MMVVRAKPKAKPVAAKAKRSTDVNTDATWPFPTPGIAKPKPKAQKAITQKRVVIAASDSKKHMVMASLNNVELAKAKSALTLDLYADGKIIGHLEVGQGSFFWTGAKRQKSKPIGWTKFAAMMNELAYPVK